MCCNQVSSGVRDAKKTLGRPPLNYRLTFATSNFRHEGRSQDQLNLLEPNLNSFKNFMKMTRTIYQLYTHVEISPS
jgi:hypothetical protein